VLILEHLHSNGIAHRDFKPENLLLTSEGKLKCIDFATADVFHLKGVNDALYHKYTKIKEKFATNPRESILERITSLSQDRKSFVGTTFYIAPEMILDQNSVDYSADLWAFGIILYRLAKNKYLFDEVNDYLIFEKIKSSSFELDKDLDSDIRDLILQLLVKDPAKRLGAGEGGFAKLKAHSFFKDIDWENVSVMESPLKSKPN
jgi:3-phosphoinositide dependent protein kinase-1